MGVPKRQRPQDTDERGIATIRRDPLAQTPGTCAYSEGTGASFQSPLETST